MKCKVEEIHPMSVHRPSLEFCPILTAFPRPRSAMVPVQSDEYMALAPIKLRIYREIHITSTHHSCTSLIINSEEEQNVALCDDIVGRRQGLEG